MRNPWVGLRPFAQDESDLFFGRDRETQILANLVATLPTLVVFAPSGTGKSSLINAGLAPQLHDDAAHLPVLVADPGQDVEAAVRGALGGNGWEPPPDGDLGDLIERHWQETERRVVVVIDQFEERLNAGAPTLELYEAAAKLVQRSSDAGCLVFSLREDYLGSLEPLMRRVPGLLNASYRVPPLSRAALVEAIYGPLEEVAAGARVEPALVDKVLDDLNQRSTQRQEPGEQRFEPGYFQIVWARLWEDAAREETQELGLARYRALGEAGEILKTFTSRILDELEPVETQVFWAMARYLVLPTGAKAALTVEDLAQLLRPEDYLRIAQWGYATPRFADEDSAWVGALRGERLTTMIRQIFGKLTSSRAPLFQRVIRSDREEFELLHDLLGRILLDWRDEYRVTLEGRVTATLAAVTRDAERRIRSWSLGDPDGPEFGERVGKRVKAALPEVRARTRALTRTRDAAALVEAKELFRLLAAIGGVSRGMGYRLDYSISSDWGEVREQAGRELVRQAIDHPSEAVRRQLQEIAPFFAHGGLDVRVKLRSGWRTFLAAAGIAVSAAALSAAAFAVAYVVLDPATPLAWLTMAHAAVAVAFAYGLVLSESSGSPPRRILGALAPSAPRFPRRRLLWLPFRLIFIWPLPAIIATLGGVALSDLYDSIGWEPIAGFNMGMLFATIAVIPGLVVSHDL